MRKKSILFGQREVGIDGAKCSNEVVFKCAYCPFGSIHSMFVRGNSLEVDAVGEECVLEVLGAFVVKDMEVRGMTMMNKEFVSLFPGISDAGAFAIGDSDSVNCVGVLMVEDEQVVIASA